MAGANGARCSLGTVNESVSHDFILSSGGKKFELLRKDIEEWRITFLDAGQNTSVDQRLLRAQKFVGDDEIFLADYADGLTDLPLPKLIEFSRRAERSPASLGNSNCEFPPGFIGDGVVEQIAHIACSGSRINGGFFVVRREIFDYIEEGEDLVEELFHRWSYRRPTTTGLFLRRLFWPAWIPLGKAAPGNLHATGHAPWQAWDPGVAVLDGR